MNKIIVKKQKELNKIKSDFNGIIYIDGGTYYEQLELRIAFDKARVIVRGEAYVRLRDSSHAELLDSSHAELRDSSHAVLLDSSHAVLWDSSHAELRDSSHAELLDSSHAELLDSSHAVLWGSSHAELRDSSHAELRGLSHAVLWGEAMVSAFSAKEIIAKGYNVISVRKSAQKDINLVINKDSYVKVIPDFEPTYSEFCKRFGITDNKKSVLLYKAVHKKDNIYFSDYKNSFEYKIGETMIHEIDKQNYESCSIGLHISHSSWARSFGANWVDMALLECEVPINKIIVAKDCNGKVRTSELKVLREVPKEEWHKLTN